MRKENGIRYVKPRAFDMPEPLSGKLDQGRSSTHPPLKQLLGETFDRARSHLVGCKEERYPIYQVRFQTGLTAGRGGKPPVS